MTTAEQRESLEQQVREAVEGRQLERAATALIEGYGPELLSFLYALDRDEALVSDAFSQFCDDLWQGLERFEGRASLRTWLYTLARHALSRCRRSEKRRARRESPLPTWADAQEKMRTATMIYLRTSVKDRMARLREELPPEDQELLILRVDRQLDWKALAQVLSDEALSEEAIKREAARLRKRFQLVKDRLREAAEREGLLEATGGAG
jgi:RNA polymerase sigma-70 factor, ECF subfamily